MNQDRRARRYLGVLVALLLMFLCSATVVKVEAHAYPVRSVPAADSVLATAPSQVTIWYSELPQAGFSTIDVFDQSLHQIDLKNSAVIADHVTVGLPSTLPNGTYTVRWTAVSAVDGHHTTGAFVFAVGQAVNDSAAAAAQTTNTAQTASSVNPVDALLKWLDLLALTTLCGAILIVLTVLRPVFGERGLSTEMSRATNWLLGAALAASLLGALVGLLIKVNSLYSSESIGLAQWVATLTTTRYGGIWLARIGLTLFVAVWLRNGKVTNTPRGLHIGLLLSFGLLLTLSLTSHSAASALWPGLALAVDWLHLVGVSAWIGGLLILAILLPMLSRDQRRNALTRFSALATVSIAVLTLTGLYSATLQLYRIEDLWESEYGRWLLLKLAIIAVMLLLGLLNNLALNPKRLKQMAVLLAPLRRILSRPDAPDQVQNRVRVESLLGISVLFVVGFLTASSPPPPPPLVVDRTLTQTRIEGDLTALLHITPNVTGPNTYSLQIKRADQPLATLNQVRAQFVLPTLDLHTPWLTFKPSADGRYSASGRELSVLGDWQILLDVQVDADSNSIRFAFPWTVSAATLGQDLSQPRPINSVMVGLLSAAVVLFAWPRILAVLRGAYGKTPEYALIALIAVIMLGSLAIIAVSAYAQNAQVAGLPTTNPIPADSTSLVKGQATYQQICAACHGAQGLGDGAAGAALSVRPANLRVHVPLHGDAVLYQMIAQGYGAMPAMGAGLTPDERWNLVNYLRTLGVDTTSSN